MPAAAMNDGWMDGWMDGRPASSYARSTPYIAYVHIHTHTETHTTHVYIHANVNEHLERMLKQQGEEGEEKPFLMRVSD